MSRIVWSPETGWTDDGPQVDMRADERGRFKAVPGSEPTVDSLARLLADAWLGIDAADTPDGREAAAGYYRDVGREIRESGLDGRRVLSVADDLYDSEVVS